MEREAHPFSRGGRGEECPLVGREASLCWPGSGATLGIRGIGLERRGSPVTTAASWVALSRGVPCSRLAGPDPEKLGTG